MDFSETSLIAWMFTREHGRVHIIAKGARRARSQFEGAIEPLVRGELVFYRKKRGSDGLETAKEFDPLDLHTGIRRDLPRLYRGLYLAELVTELSEHELASGVAFEAASEALRSLARDPSDVLDLALFRAELLLLREAGLSPCLDACVRCDRPANLDGPGSIWFSAASGGALCPEHGGGETAAQQTPRWVLRLLNDLTQGKAVSGLSDAAPVRDLLDRFFTHHLAKRLKLQRFLRTPAAVLRPAVPPQGPNA
jgi:DNA repair protein RecO (recombination protein O)